MKKLLFSCIILFSSPLLVAKIGCYQYNNPDSYFNYQEKTYVECYCPCTYIDKHNQCLECGHFHDAMPITVVTRSQELPIKNNNAVTVAPMKATYAALAKNFKEKQHANASKTE